MIILVPDYVAKKIDFENNAQIVALSNIFSSFREGKHYVMFSNILYDLIMMNASCFARETISSVKQAAMASVIIKKCFISCSSYIQVSFGDDIAPYSDIKNKKHVIAVPIDKFSDSEVVQKTELISENKNDGIFYRFASKYYCMEIDLPDFINFRNTGGGGDTTGDNFEESQNTSKNPVFCVVDNDKRSPTCVVGDTAKKVIKSKRVDAISGLRVLDVHSIESLVPNKTYKRVFRGDVNKAKALNAYDIIESKYPVAKKYIKIREGIPCLKKIKSSNVANYWQGIMREPSLMRCDTNLCDPRCGCELGAIPGLGNKLVDKVVSNWSNESVDTFLDDIRSWSEIRMSWMDIGRDIFSWCCAPKPLAYT